MSNWQVRQPRVQNQHEKDLVDQWGPCVLRLFSPYWFRCIFRKRYATILLLVIYTACTAGAVLASEFQGWDELATVLFIIPWLCTFSFQLGDITTLAYNRDKKDDQYIGSFRVIISYVLFVLSSGGLYTTLWLWHRDSFSNIETASPAEAWNILTPTALFVAPGVGFSTSVALSIGANWLVGSVAFLTHIFFAFIVVVAFMDFKAWNESQGASPEKEDDDYVSTAVSSIRSPMNNGALYTRNVDNDFFVN